MTAELKTPIKTAIIGYGQSGELSHAYGIGENPEFEISAICDLSAQRRSYAEETLGCTAYADYRELIQKEKDLSLAAIVTRSDTHCDVACNFLEAGINVLVTKPWAVNATEARKMIDAQKLSGKQIFPWIPMYWSPEYLRIANLIQEGAIGRVFTIRRYIAQFCKRSDWQTELKYGGGSLNNWGAHIVQPVIGLANSPISKLSGHLSREISGGDGDDSFLAIMQFENGITGIAEHVQAACDLPSFMIQGTNGTIVSDGVRITLHQQDPSSKEPAIQTEYPIEGKRFGDEADIYRDVAISLRQGSPFKVSTEESYYGTLVLDTIRLSSRSASFLSPATKLARTA